MMGTILWLVKDTVLVTCYFTPLILVCLNPVNSSITSKYIHNGYTNWKLWCHFWHQWSIKCHLNGARVGLEVMVPRTRVRCTGRDYLTLDAGYLIMPRAMKSNDVITHQIPCNNVKICNKHILNQCWSNIYGTRVRWCFWKNIKKLGLLPGNREQWQRFIKWLCPCLHRE